MMTKTDALSAFMRSKNEVDEILKELTNLSDDHFGVAVDDDDNVSKNDVDLLGEILKDLKKILLQSQLGMGLGDDPMGDHHGRNL